MTYVRRRSEPGAPDPRAPYGWVLVRRGELRWFASEEEALRVWRDRRWVVRRPATKEERENA